VTFHNLVDEIVTMQKPKPVKTHENLLLDEKLMSQGNVKISSRRVSPVDRHREVGRLKVIQAVLRERGLPLLPENFQEKQDRLREEQREEQQQETERKLREEQLKSQHILG
jgi:hypothetical protein